MQSMHDKWSADTHREIISSTNAYNGEHKASSVAIEQTPESLRNRRVLRSCFKIEAQSAEFNLKNQIQNGCVVS